MDAVPDDPAAPGGGELTYSTYLHLDELLSCQHTPSGSHDELLFVVIHQVYELWFKQLLHEGDLLVARLEAGHAGLGTARRMAKILKTAVGQLDVLETMTPRQFAAFRPGLSSASGFQSLQFRRVEAQMGRRDFPAVAFDADPALVGACARRSLFDALLCYLAADGADMPAGALERDWARPRPADPAVDAALAAVYAAERSPALEVCEALVDLDEGVQEWRYRHVKAVERILGSGRPGTGGSSGVDYLRSTLFAPAFPELWAVRAGG